VVQKSQKPAINAGCYISQNKQAQRLWLEQNREQLIEQYFETQRANNQENVLDPDAVRDLFKPIGYSLDNVADFRELEQTLVAELYSRMLEKTAEEHKPVTFLTGMPGAGKSSATRAYTDTLKLNE